MSTHVELRRATYRDSVSLMQVSRRVQDTPGVQAALVAMATELNLGLLAGLGLTAPAGAGPNDLLVGLRADDDDAVRAALQAVEDALATPARRTGNSTEDEPPRSTRSAAARLEGTLALVSVPGRHAFAEAMDALDSGLSVMVFSDGVPVAQEVHLKQVAAERDLLVMGPDCGTAVVGGVGLGFADVVQPGPVGLVAASGTGAQQLMCLLDAAGVGISCCLGVGGRDLSAAVGGRSTRQALAALDADPATELVVLVSKPPAAEVGEAVRALAGTLRTPVHLALLGPGRPDLTEVAEAVVRATGRQVPPWPRWPAPGGPPVRPGALRGLFAGGTLCDEAMLIASAALGPVASNIPLQPGWALPADLAASGHAMLDFGDDALTAGRPHPMIDGSLRLARLQQEVDDPTTGVVLLDVVLGHGAHPDPAADLVPAVRRAREQAVGVVVSLCGSSGDPQGRDGQAERLREAGAEVFLSNAAAARHAVSLVRGRPG